VHPFGGLIPQLSTVAAWAASLSKEIRKGLISQEPLALFKGDLSNWEAEDLARLTNSLLTAYERKKIHDFLPGIGYAYSKLAHPGLAAQLRPYIADPTKDVQARRTACSIAEACELTALQSDLLRVALDPSDDPSVRARAVSALGNCGDDSVAEQLLPLAKGELGPDPMDDIKGQALDVLWPKHVNAADLFSLLTPPNEGNFGAYAMFLTETLPESIPAADLLPALRWATVLVNARRVHITVSTGAFSATQFWFIVGNPSSGLTSRNRLSSMCSHALRMAASCLRVPTIEGRRLSTTIWTPMLLSGAHFFSLRAGSVLDNSRLLD
jgi:hypothetical protein